MGNPQELVTYIHNGKPVTQKCQILFQEVMAEGQLSWGCGNTELWEVVREPCACHSAEGVLYTNYESSQTRNLQDTPNENGQLLFGKQWTLPYDESSPHPSFVSSAAFDVAHNRVYMIGTVGPNACWLGTLDLETQELHQQILSSNDDANVQACQNLIVYDSNRIFAIGHASRGEGFLSYLDEEAGPPSPGAESQIGVYGMVLDLRRVELPSPPVEQQQMQQRSNIFARNLVGNIFGAGNETANATAVVGNDANATEVEADILSVEAINLTNATSDEEFVDYKTGGNLTTIDTNETDDSVDSNSTTNDDGTSQENYGGKYTNELNQTETNDQIGNSTDFDDTNMTDPTTPPSEGFFDGNETDDFDLNTTDPEEEWGDSNSTGMDSNSKGQDDFDSNSTLATPAPEGEGSNSTNSNSTDHGDEGSNSTLAPAPEEGTNNTYNGDSNYTDTNSTDFDGNKTDHDNSKHTDANSTDFDCNNTANCGDFDDGNSTDLDDSNSTNYGGDSNSTGSNSTDLDDNETDYGEFNSTDTNSTGPDCNSPANCGNSNSTDLDDLNSTDHGGDTDTNSTDVGGNQTDSGDFNFTDTDSTDFDDSNSTDYGDSNYTDTNSTDPDGNTTDVGDLNSTDPVCNSAYCGDSNYTDSNSTGLDKTNSTDFDGNTTGYDPRTSSPTSLASHTPTQAPTNGVPTSSPTPLASDSPTQAPPTGIPTSFVSDTIAPTTGAPSSSPTLLEPDAPTREPFTYVPTSPPTEKNNTDYGVVTPAPIPEEESPEDGTNSTQDLIGEDGFSLQVKGGRILNGQDVYPLHITSDNDFVYVASLEASGDSDPNVTLSLGFFEIDPSKSNRIHLKVSALPVTPTFPQISTPIGNTLAAPMWEQILLASEADSILGVGGIVRMGNAIYVGGSTKGKGAGLGADDTPGDVDGFVTKLSKDTGAFLGTDGEPSETLSSYRVQSSTKADDFVRGLCVSSAGQTFIYVAGSSIDTATGNGTRAFLTKLRVVDWVPMWTADLRAEGPLSGDPVSIVGISCAVTNDEDFVFFTGNVENGGLVAGSNVSGSAGGTDIFVAKIDGETGSVVFTRQIGSAGDDFVAPGKSISLKADGTVIVVGSSNGQLYGARNTSFSSQFDAFVAIVTHDGSVPTMVYLPPVPTSSPTAAPTSEPIEDSQNSTPPPTAEPEAQATASPTLAFQTFTFKGMTLRLEGARPLTSDSRRDFEKTIETFYREYYAHTISRRLQISNVDQFVTTISAGGEHPDLLGNTIKYDQTVSFVTAHDGNATINEAKSLITSPFQFAETKRILLNSLRASSDSFQTLISIGDPGFTVQEDAEVGPPEPARGMESDSGVNIMLYFFIVLCVFGLCLFGALGFLFYHLQRQRKRREAKAKAAPVLAPTLDAISSQGRRLSRVKNTGDYSAAYLTDLADIENIANRSTEFDYKSYNASGDFGKSFNASQDFSHDGSQDKIRVNLPVRKGRYRSSSRESCRQNGRGPSPTTGSGEFDDEYDEDDPGYGHKAQRDQFSEGSSNSQDYIDEDDDQDYTEGDRQDYTEGYSDNTGSQDRSYSDSYNDEEMQVQTPKKSGIIADCFDTPKLEEQHSDSYNSFFEQFGGDQDDFPEPVPDLGMGIDSARGSSYRSDRDEEAGSFSNSHSGSQALGSYEGSESSDSEPHIKVAKESEDVSSFSGGDGFGDDWAKGF